MTRSALIIAHGQPSDPLPAERTLAELAAKTAGALPGWQIGSATLAAPDGLKARLAQLADPVIFPLFMTDGWFVRTLLPQRLAEAGMATPKILRPFGMMPDCQALAGRITADAASAAGWRIAETTLILAAHGSRQSRLPAHAVDLTIKKIALSYSFAEIRAGFIEESPTLADAACDTGPNAICLPLFVARWGHVETDIPKALAQSGFQGRLLHPIGTHAEVVAIIARALGNA